MDDAPDWYEEPPFWSRFAARLIDSLLVFVVGLALLPLGERAELAGLVALDAIYETTLVALRGQTIGKRVIGLRVADLATGEHPDLESSFLRWLIPSIGSVALIAAPDLAGWDLAVALVVYLPILRPPLHRGLHDYGAQTIVTASRR